MRIRLNPYPIKLRDPLKHLIFSIFLLITGGLTPAYAQAVIDESMSGSWYDPSHDGEGFLLEVLEDQKAVVYWFTYDENGDQRWFIGLGEVQNDTAVFDELLIATGPVFGAEFNTDDVEYSDIGTLSLNFENCSTATATYTVDNVPGTQNLNRISTLSGLECEGPISLPSPTSGSWFDQTHDGEGLVIQHLNDARVLVFWFSYDSEGRQVWFFGLGEQDGTTVTISEANITNGGRFGQDFDPDQVEMKPWGSLVIELGCEFGKLDYSSDLADFGNGKQTLTRLTSPGSPECEEAKPPNILLVIADDLGLDASSQYTVAAEHPVTPTLDRIAAEGLVFENAWANPTCSPTRAGILTGKYGTRTRVLAPSDVLSEQETSLQSFIHQHLPGKYVDAVIGKWHLAEQPGGQDHPSNLGIGYYAGVLGGGVEDYENWMLSTNGQRSNETTYVTSKLVDLAVEWTGEQGNPWFLWLAFNAPHTPFHLPPEDLHSRELSGTVSDIAANPLPYYFAAIEAMDTEIGRLLDSLDAETRANTIIIFVGDNGTPGQVAQSPYSRTKAKGSLYQGGVNVPLFISGPGITRISERETALVNTTDLFSTIAALAGVNVDEVHDSISFTNLHNEETEHERFFQYSEKSTDTGEEWTVSDGMYKLIESSTGAQQFYQLTVDPYEDEDLIETGTAPIDIIEDLQILADQIRHDEVTGEAQGYAIVDTGQLKCYDNTDAMVTCPASSAAFYGQDAQHMGNTPDYTDNGNGTVSDNITGLMWQQSPDTNEDSNIDADDKLTYPEAQTYCDNLNLAGNTDWWLPDIKQLYSLIDFSGTDPSGYEGTDTAGLTPFINTSYFDFGYGDTNAGERIIDAQYASNTPYVANTANDGIGTLFGVNFADGRIKGYGLSLQGQHKTFYVMCTRGNSQYGKNGFEANDDGTVTEKATGLMWPQQDSMNGLNWEQALAWVDQQNTTNYLGYSDWRLPNAKELQSLVDYTRSPGTSSSAAIDSLFNATSIVNEAGATDYPAYWTGTTHSNWTLNPGSAGVYVNFGRSMGYMNNNWVDVHGAGAQRSDPKAGDPTDYPTGRGPQGDAIRIYNHVRLVRSTQ